MHNEKLVHAFSTPYGTYQIVDMTYNSRPARLLYSGGRLTSQSGLALDDQDELLFDYNQRFKELFLGLRPARVLLLGGGACTLPRELLKVQPELYIDIVEIDAQLPAIGASYFGFVKGRHCVVYIMPAEQFLEQAANEYDLILVDVFIQENVPLSLQTPKIAKLLARNLRPTGVVAVNVIASYNGERSQVLKREVAALSSTFSQIEVFPAGYESSLWLPQNFIITAQNNPQSLQPYLRYAAVQSN